MKPTEAAALCKYVEACCPQQKFDEHTPDVWFDLLEDIPLGVAMIGAREVAKRQPFVAPSEIRNAVKRLRVSLRPVALQELPRPVLADPEWAENGHGYQLAVQRHRAAVEAVTDRLIVDDDHDLGQVDLNPSAADVEMEYLNPPKIARKAPARLGIEA